MTYSFHLDGDLQAFDFNGFCGIGVLPLSFMAAVSEADG